LNRRRAQITRRVHIREPFSIALALTIMSPSGKRAVGWGARPLPRSGVSCNGFRWRGAQHNLIGEGSLETRDMVKSGGDAKPLLCITGSSGLHYNVPAASLSCQGGSVANRSIGGLGVQRFRPHAEHLSGDDEKERLNLGGGERPWYAGKGGPRNQSDISGDKVGTAGGSGTFKSK